MLRSARFSQYALKSNFPKKPQDPWKRVLDKSSGQYYWWNTMTDQTTEIGAQKPVGSYHIEKLPTGEDPEDKRLRESGITGYKDLVLDSLKFSFIFGGAFILVMRLVVSVISKEHTIDENNLKCFPKFQNDNINDVLYDPEYDYSLVAAPVANGYLLKFISIIMSDLGFVSDILTRYMLNGNKFHCLREMAHLIRLEGKTYFQYFPISGPSPYDSVEEGYEYLNSEEFWKKQFSLLNDLGGGFDDYVNHVNSHVLSLAMGYRLGVLDPLKIAHLVIGKIEELNGEYGFLKEYANDILIFAKESSDRFKLKKPLSIWDGIPVSFKDEVEIAGLYNDKGMKNHTSMKPAVKDDSSVRRFRLSGAIIIGSTVMHELGVSPLGYNYFYGGSRNSKNSSFYSGGSSGGSAVMVGLNIVPFSLGFDGGGSIRLPASMNGVVGLSTTYSSLHFDSPAVGLKTTIHAGPIATTAKDAAISMCVLGRKSAGHLYEQINRGSGFNLGKTFYEDILFSKKASKLRMGVFKPWVSHFKDNGENERHVYDNFNALVRRLEHDYIDVIPIEIPHLYLQQLSHAVIISSEFFSLHEHKLGNSKYELQPATRIQLAIGKALKGVDILAAGTVRGWASSLWGEIFQNVDVVATPTMPFSSIELFDSDTVLGKSDTTLIVNMLSYINIGNLLGFPAISMPSGNATGMPSGVQFIANHWNDHYLLKLGVYAERLFDRREFFPYV